MIKNLKGSQNSSNSHSNSNRGSEIKQFEIPGSLDQ